ncbi:hypothetical protein C9374_013270 [Naegleria lovaniensis]|uniref:Kinesin-like protein n=1 Tax=Naegleria lovaniensis TaxID=51637 RepID=A0AA88GYY7_NAELO|nr:uncharacterized protein C9374_013270 [Naegleria lovaniensis]KAG2391785.1 hypothetical protein C9374_013270 [Naegleria lovaniensis]
MLNTSLSSVASSFGSGSTSSNMFPTPTSSISLQGSKVRVVCRVRPLLEMESGGKMCLDVPDQENVVVTSKGLTFSYDEVFGAGTSQSEVFETVGRPLIDDIIKGYNCTIFAYGQTSSGKTYSMMNLPKDPYSEERGIAPRIVCTLFEAIDQSPENIEFTVKVSFFEIYMEKIFDLFEPSKQNLAVKEDTSEKTFYVEDLSELYVSSEEEVLRLMKIGCKNKKISSTKMNRDSSRSHTIFSVTVTQHDTKKGQKISSKLYLVDLAGSEKVCKTEATGLRLEEAKTINKSLATLAKVISALTEKNPHIPYRESKLTKLLQDALGGNTRTTLMINCSPSNLNEDETISTLRFGLTANSIKNKPKVNFETSDTEYKKQLTLARNEIIGLKTKNIQLEAELVTLKASHTNYEKLSFANNLLLKQAQQKDDSIEALNLEILKLRRELDLMKGKHEQLNIAMGEKTSSLISELVEYKKQCSELQSDNQLLKQQISNQQVSTSPTLIGSTPMDLNNPEVRLESISDIDNTGKYSKAVDIVLDELMRIKMDRSEIQEMVANASSEIRDYMDQILSGQQLSEQEIQYDALSKISEKDVSELEINFSAQELKDYVQMLEEQNKSIKNELEAFLKGNSQSRQVVGDTDQDLQILTNTTDPIKNGLSASSLHGGKVVVPLKGGFKKQQKTLNDSLDDEEEIIGSEMVKCGQVFILSKSSNSSQDVWKKRWLVIGYKTPQIKIYKTIKSITPQLISLSTQSTLIKNDSEYILSISNTSIGDIHMKFSSTQDIKEWNTVIVDVLDMLQSSSQ